MFLSAMISMKSSYVEFSIADCSEVNPKFFDWSRIAMGSSGTAAAIHASALRLASRRRCHARRPSVPVRRSRLASAGQALPVGRLVGVPIFAVVARVAPTPALPLALDLDRLRGGDHGLAVNSRLLLRHEFAPLRVGQAALCRRRLSAAFAARDFAAAASAAAAAVRRAPPRPRRRPPTPPLRPADQRVDLDLETRRPAGRGS